jgi:hypothetical protein
MRKIILAFVLITGTISMVNAQDVITRKNGSEIRAKVVEVGLSEIKYKMYGNESGPTYTLPKSEIFMIKYETGNKDVFDNEPAQGNVSGNQNNVSGNLQQPGVSVNQPQEFDRKACWGIKFGVNIATVNLSSGSNSAEMDDVVGAVGGVTLYTPFTPKWGLHTGVEISMKGFAYDDGDGTCRAIYLQAPVEVGYKIRLGNNGWNFEPRLGLYLAYGIAGKLSTDNGSADTFGDEVLNPFDVGVAVGFHFGNDKFDIALHGESGLSDVKGDQLTTSGTRDITMNTSNIAIVVGLKF